MGRAPVVSVSQRIRRVSACLALASVSTLGSTKAEILILTDGQRVETRGPWEHKGGLILYTSSAGSLTSIRTSLVDLEATERANSTPEPPQADGAVSAESNRPAVVITQSDVGDASAAAVSTAQLMTHLMSLSPTKGRQVAAALRPSLQKIVRLDLEVDILSTTGLRRTIPLLEADVVKFRRLADRETDPDVSKAYDLLASDTERFLRLVSTDSESALDEDREGWRAFRQVLGYEW